MLKETFNIILQILGPANPWLLSGIFGLFLIKNREVKYFFLSLILSFFILIVAMSFVYHSYLANRLFILITPFLTIGSGLFIIFFANLFRFHSPAYLILGLFIFYIIFEDTNNIKTNFRTGLFKVVAASTIDTEQAANFINQNTNQNDLVISSEILGWLLKCKTSLFTQILADNDLYFGLANFSKQRFVFENSLPKAKFVVIDNCAYRFQRKLTPAVKKTIDAVMINWKEIKEIGEYKIYKNPNCL